MAAIINAVIKVAKECQQVAEDLKTFKKSSKNLAERIHLLTDTIKRAYETSQQSAAGQEDKKFIPALKDLQTHIEKIKSFLEKLNNMSRLIQIVNRNYIKGKFCNFNEILNGLIPSLLLLFQIEKSADFEERFIKLEMIQEDINFDLREISALCTQMQASSRASASPGNLVLQEAGVVTMAGIACAAVKFGEDCHQIAEKVESLRESSKILAEQICLMTDAINLTDETILQSIHGKESHNPLKNELILSNYNISNAKDLEAWVEILPPKLSCSKLDLSTINLNGITGKKITEFLMRFDNLETVDISCCLLTGKQISDMIQECRTKNVMLENMKLNLQGNNLSGAESNVLSDLFMIIYHYSNKLELSHYYFQETDLTNWADSLDECELPCDTLNFSFINLSSSITGKTLAKLLIKFNGLKRVDMSFCRLTGPVISEMIQERKQNEMLENTEFILKGNSLSGASNEVLPYLVRSIYHYDKELRLSGYYFTDTDLTNLVDSLDEHELSCSKLDLSYINLSNMSGKTLAELLMRFDDKLKHVDMNRCQLNGNIINEMIKECKENSVALENIKLNLEGNNLIGVDQTLFSEFIENILYS